ncbi:MAG: glycosyltransferase family 4 protein [Candidatus Omnitrophica bacterium]|nr:glycosyltransferase family 4 protein [Candidatus Omnitrophota bacterium]
MIKILMLNYEFPPLGGGAGNANLYLLKEFSKYEDVHIDLVTSAVGKYGEQKFSDNIKIFFLDIGKDKNLHYQSNKDLLTYAFKSYFFCKKLVEKQPYQLCHAFFGLPCGFIAMLLGIPYIVSLRGSDVPFYNLRFYWWDKLLFRVLSRRVWRKASHVIALSNALKNLAKMTADVDMKVIYNGIDCQEFYPQEETLRREQTFNILYVGRLIERKGIIYLLEAFKEFTGQFNKSRLIIVGEGPLKSRLIKYCLDNGIQDRVQFLGLIEHHKICTIYQRSHAIVIPSLQEALGNVTQEAMACGLPVITTDTGAAELLKDNGFVLEKKDPQKIFQVLKNIFMDADARVRMGARSREIAHDMSWGHIAHEYYQLYNRFVKRERR